MAGAAGAGIERVNADLDKQAAAAEKAAEKIELARKAAQEAREEALRLADAWTQVTTNWENGTTVMKSMTQSFMTLLDIQKEINAGYQQSAQAAGGNKSYDAATANKLENLVGQITQVAGPNNFFAATIETQVTQLKAGTITSAQAMDTIRGLLGPFISGLMQEVADPNTNPAMRALDLALERFLLGGGIPT